MITRRSLGSLLLLSAVACTQRAADVAPTPVILERAPLASIRAQYSGGLLNRQVEATFRLEESGYALVGHLGGDGMIQILYPASTRLDGWTPGKKSIRVDRFAAENDGAPFVFRYSGAPYRNAGAQMDSYDGLGHGFIFVITSKFPLNFAPIHDGLEFRELEVADYDYTSDPRRAIATLASHVALPGYRVRYATSFGSIAMYSAAALAFDCALIANTYGRGDFWDFGYYPSGFTSLGMPLFGGIYFGSSLRRGSPCGMNRYYTNRYAYWYPYTLPTGGTTTRPTGTPTEPVTPSLTRMRPRVSDTEGTRVANFGGRSAIDRPTILARDATPRSNGSRERATRPTSRTTGERVEIQSIDRNGRGRSFDEGRRSTGHSEPSRPTTIDRGSDSPRSTTVTPARETPATTQAQPARAERPPRPNQN